MGDGESETDTTAPPTTTIAPTTSLPTTTPSAEKWSSDGKNFTQIVSKGFGNKDNNSMYPFIYKDQLIVRTGNSKTGGEIWRTKDGLHWERIHKQKEPSMTNMGGMLFFKGHIYICINDISKGLEIWKSE
ncbi:MAG: hypothetical protein ACXQTP_01210 [Candidatus Methanofastidiosia archaeon]